MSKQHDQFEHWCQSAQKRIECLERSNAALRGHLKRAKMKRYGVTGAYSISKIEKGVMIIKGDKAWGIIYEYGQPTTYGWVAPRDAGIHDPQYCKKTTDATWEDSCYEYELATGELVLVERRTEVVFMPRYKRRKNKKEMKE